MKGNNYRRGDIIIVDFGLGMGSEQGGVRPALVIQNDKGNYYSPTLQVAPITSQVKKLLPTHMQIDKSSGLVVDSTVLFEQSRVIDKQRVQHYVGHIVMGLAADLKIAIAFGCLSFLQGKYERLATVPEQQVSI